MKPKKWERTLRSFAIVLLILTGVSAAYAGIGFMLEPTGTLVGIPPSYLATSPFHTFFIPGLVLFIFIGIISLTTSIICIMRMRFYPHFILAEGILLSGWIIVETIMVSDFNAMQATCLSIGIILILIGYYYLKKQLV